MSESKRDKDNSNRTHKVTVRFTDDEYEQLGVICEVLDVTYSHYLRRAAFTRRIESPTLRVAFRDEAARALAAQMGKIGGLLNQIARKLNSGEQCDRRMTEDIARAIDQLNERLRFLRNVEAFSGDSEAS